jgi:hypothetical protein
MNLQFNTPGQLSICMNYPKINMNNKSLLKLLWVLSAVVISYSVQLNRQLPAINIPQANQREQVKMPMRFQIAGTIAEVPAIPIAWQWLVKYTWEGGVQQFAFNRSRICITLFLQNKNAEIHALIFVQQILFPAHYFW